MSTLIKVCLIEFDSYFKSYYYSNHSWPLLSLTDNDAVGLKEMKIMSLLCLFLIQILLFHSNLFVYLSCRKSRLSIHDGDLQQQYSISWPNHTWILLKNHTKKNLNPRLQSHQNIINIKVVSQSFSFLFFLNFVARILFITRHVVCVKWFKGR